MPTRLIVLVAIFACHCGNAQNLVPNPSFEDTLICPEYPGQVQSSIGWNAWRETPDYFNVCSNTICDAGYYCAHVPDNFAGYQMASTGNAYCGLYCYGNGKLPAREAIGTALNEPLEPGTTYHVSFKISLAIDGYPGLHWSCNKIGVKFAMSSFDSNLNPIPVDNVAHVYLSELITDTAEWHIVEGDYLATQSFTHIGIGNFFDDLNTDTIHVNAPSSGGVYFYVDDVCVTANNNCDPVGVIEQGLLEPNVWFDGNDLIVHSDFPVGIEVYTLHGSLVFSNNISKNQHAISMDILSSGIYLVKILSSEGTIYKKVYKS